MHRQAKWRVVAVAAGLAGVLAAARPANAGTITDTGGFAFPPGSFANIGGFVAQPNPNNDNTTSASPNILTLEKSYGSFGVIDLEFGVANSGGTTEHFFDENIVRNLSGIAWSDYHFQLGFGLGQAFVPSTLGDALDFDTPQRDPTPTSTVFTTLNHQDDSIAWSDGVLPVASFGAFTFSIDVPDHNAAIPAGFETRDATGLITGYRFTLRQFPTVDTAVPEPTSVVLLGIGLSGVIASRRFKRGW